MGDQYACGIRIPGASDDIQFSLITWQCGPDSNHEVRSLRNSLPLQPTCRHLSAGKPQHATLIVRETMQGLRQAVEEHLRPDSPQHKTILPGFIKYPREAIKWTGWAAFAILLLVRLILGNPVLAEKIVKALIG